MSTPQPPAHWDEPVSVTLLRTAVEYGLRCQLKPGFLALWRRLFRQDGEHVFDLICHHYAEDHRHYHTLQHIAECLALLEAVTAPTFFTDEVELAIWFHDVIYDPHKSDNEVCSALFAVRQLQLVNAHPDLIAQVVALIKCTEHHDPQTPPEKIMCDIDLAILSADPVRFAEYETQIRHEYHFVGDAEYCYGRRLVLQHFMDCTPLYHVLNLDARTNLTKALAMVTTRPDSATLGGGV